MSPRPHHGRSLTALACSASGVILILVCYLVPPRQLKESAAKEIARQWFPQAKFESAELVRGDGNSWRWHLRFVADASSNANLLVIDAESRELVRLTRWSTDSQLVTPSLVSP